MVFANIDKCFPNDTQQLLIHLFIGFLDFIVCYENIRCIDIGTIKAFGVIKNSFISSLPHILDNIVYPAFKLPVVVGASL